MFVKIAALKVEIGRTSEALREKELIIETMSAVAPLEKGVVVGGETSAENRQSVDTRQSVGSQVFGVLENYLERIEVGNFTCVR